MQVTAAATLHAWECALEVEGQDRALTLAREMTGADASGFSLGQRDAVLLRAYRDIRGSTLDAIAVCAVCGTTLEVHLPISDLVEGYPEQFEDLPPIVVQLDSTAVVLRCPTTADLHAIARIPSVEGARSALLARCVVPQQDAGTSASGLSSLSDAQIAELGRRIETADPLVDVRIAIECAECGNAWSALLDVPELVWQQVRGVAATLLREVHTLAQRYGWTEAEVLQLSDRRRRAYLELT